MPDQTLTIRLTAHSSGLIVGVDGGREALDRLAGATDRDAFHPRVCGEHL